MARAPRLRPRLALSLAACLALMGCDKVGQVLVNSANTVFKPKPALEQGDDTKSERSVSPNGIISLLSGQVLVPKELAPDGKLLVARTHVNVTAPDAGARPGAAAQFGILQATSTDVPVAGAYVGVRGWDLKTIPQLLNKPSGEDGKFYFKYVPSGIAFFLEASIETDTTTYQMYGLTRTEETGSNTQVTVDVASTLLARQLMRIWQLSDYRVSFKDLSPKDFNPLLANLRAVLRGGMPADIPLDLSKVSQPSGKWSDAADRKDSALLFLDKLAEREPTVMRDIERLYKAVNVSLTNSFDESRFTIKRPSSLAQAPVEGASPTTPGTQTPGGNAITKIFYFGSTESRVLAGGKVGKPADGTGALAVLGNNPFGSMWMLPEAGQMLFTDGVANQLRSVGKNSGEVKLEAGDPTGLSGDPGSSAVFLNNPGGVAIKGDFMYIADTGNNRILKRDTSGNLTVFAGGATGTGVKALKDGASSEATFNRPTSIGIANNLVYVVDSGNNALRAISLADGQVKTIAGGNKGRPENVTVVEKGKAAHFDNPTGMAFSPNAAVVVITDTNNHCVRAVWVKEEDPSVRMFAGTLEPGDDDGIDGTFNKPVSIVSDNLHLYVGELGNPRIRVITQLDRTVSTLLGLATPGTAVGFKTTAAFTQVTGLGLEFGDGPVPTHMYAYDANPAGPRLLKIDFSPDSTSQR